MIVYIYYDIVIEIQHNRHAKILNYILVNIANTIAFILFTSYYSVKIFFNVFKKFC